MLEFWHAGMKHDAGMLAPVKSAPLAFGISRGKNAGINHYAGMLECWNVYPVKPSEIRYAKTLSISQGKQLEEFLRSRVSPGLELQRQCWSSSPSAELVFGIFR